jgi:hypothetical protein
VSLNALGRHASSMRRRTADDFPPPDDHTVWLTVDVTPESEPPIRRQVHGPSPAVCCPAIEGRYMTHTHTCRMWQDADLPVRYPVAGPIGGHRG